MNEEKAERTQITFRLSAELLNRIERLAKKDRRNRSNMIEYMLRESIPALEKK
jgi:hypothetical protein